MKSYDESNYRVQLTFNDSYLKIINDNFVFEGKLDIEKNKWHKKNA
jgi:hypothetical protein